MTTSKALFDIPSGAVAQVHIIDSTTRISDMPASFLLVPSMQGFDKLPPFGSWSFLIQSSKGQKALFDLGVPPNINSSTPSVLKQINESGIKFEATKHVAEILKGNGVDPVEIGSVIWSHHHFDHVGDITTFPGTTELVTGSGFRDAYYPGYPTQPDSTLHESYFEGRALREINFSEQSPPLKAGGFRAYDFFGDGSFYLLDAPGHDIGHLVGLARTTINPDTFILMGGDLCHHGGEIRPSPYLSVPAEGHFPLPDSIRSRMAVCPGDMRFEELNLKRGRKPNEPFFDPVLAVDMAQAVQSIQEAQVADAQSDVFFIFAHDMGIQGTVDFFPHSANNWKEKGWREKTLWNFLGDLTLAVVSNE